MSGFLLDTNVISEFARPDNQPDRRVKEWLEAADRWGVLAAAAHRKGTPLAIIDGLLSATALEHKLTVVTRNSADFMSIGVSVLNPWQT